MLVRACARLALAQCSAACKSVRAMVKARARATRGTVYVVAGGRLVLNSLPAQRLDRCWGVAGAPPSC